MANVNVRFSATMVDELGTTASTLAYGTVPDTVTLAQIAASWVTWADALDGVTDAAIKGGRVDLLKSYTSADKGNGAGLPATAARVEQTGVVNLSSTGTRHRWGTVIPALKNAMIVAGKLNLTDGAVTTLIGVLTGALNGGNYTNPNSQAIGTVVDAILSFRKRRKQLQRTSFEIPVA